jgi:hypothetical protein
MRVKPGAARCAASLCAIGLLSSAALGQDPNLVLYEGFDYPTTASTEVPGPARGLSGTDGTTIDTQVNGGGAGGYANPSNGQTWVPKAASAGAIYSVANDAHIVASNLTVAGLQASVGNAASYGNLGHTPLLPLGQTFTPSLEGTSVYYSLAFRVDDMTNLTSAGGIVAGLSNVVPTGSLGNPSVAEAAVFVRPDPANPTTHYQIGLGKTLTGGTGANYTSSSFALGATQFVVGRYTMFDANGSPEPNTNPAGTNDVANLWVNPNQSTFGALAAPAADLQNGPLGNDPPGANNTIQSVFLRQSGAANGQNVADVIVADELRVGLSWAAVTPTDAGGDGDFDFDGDTDGNDFLLWQRGQSTNPLSSGDLADWQANFGLPATVAGAPVPEPATGVIAALGAAMAAAMQRRKRKRA